MAIGLGALDELFTIKADSPQHDRIGQLGTDFVHIKGFVNSPENVLSLTKSGCQGVN